MRRILSACGDPAENWPKDKHRNWVQLKRRKTFFDATTWFVSQVSIDIAMFTYFWWKTPPIWHPTSHETEKKIIDYVTESYQEKCIKSRYCEVFTFIVSCFRGIFITFVCSIITLMRMKWWLSKLWTKMGARVFLKIINQSIKNCIIFRFHTKNLNSGNVRSFCY